MARRDRVTHHKQLAPGAKRNVNPKLSAYQREQKRNKMANQPPVNISARDFPASARGLVQFLDRNRERRALARERAEAAAAAAAESSDHVAASSTAAAPTPVVGKRKALEQPPKLPVDAKAAGESNVPTVPKKEKRLDPIRNASSLNVQLSTESVDADMAGRTRFGVLEKKAKLREKKKLARREKHKVTLQSQYRSLARTDDAASAALAASQIEELRRKKAASRASAIGHSRDAADVEQDGDGDEYAVYQPPARSDNGADGGNSDSGDDGAANSVDALVSAAEAHGHKQYTQAVAADAADEKPKPKPIRRLSSVPVGTDFSTLRRGDAPRFGDRADAPPVLDVVPNANAAVMKYADRTVVGSASHALVGSRLHSAAPGAKTGVSAALAKALNQLANAPSAPQLPIDDAEAATAAPGKARSVSGARLSSTEDFAAMRDRVMASYAQHRQKSFFQSRKQLPTFK